MADSDISTKVCARCKSVFKRPQRISQKQWESRAFCLQRCSGERLDFDVTEIVKKYEGGIFSNQIGKELGISSVHVLRILKAAGMLVRETSENKRLTLNRPEVKKKMRESALGRKLKETAKEKLRQLYVLRTRAGGVALLELDLGICSTRKAKRTKIMLEDLSMLLLRKRNMAGKFFLENMCITSVKIN